MSDSKCKQVHLTCRYLNDGDGSCSIGVNGGYCLPIWEGTNCEKAVVKEKVAGTPFNKIVDSINERLKAADEVCRKAWHYNHGKCPLQDDGETEEIIVCGYPERINSTRENNCTYESCPLVHK